MQRLPAGYADYNVHRILEAAFRDGRYRCHCDGMHYLSVRIRDTGKESAKVITPANLTIL